MSLSANAITKFQGKPPHGGIKYTGWENFAIFDQSHRSHWKWYEIGPWLGLKKKYCCFRKHGQKK